MFFDYVWGNFWLWTIIVCAIVFGIWNYIDMRGFWDAIFVAGIAAALSALVGAFAYFVVADAIAYQFVKVDASWSRPIESLGDGNGTSGQFFLGGGTIENSPVYMYYLRDGDQYRLYHADADQTYITYTDGTPEMVVHYKKSGNEHWSHGWGGDSEEYRTYEFRVPQGSVKQSFNLDAQ